MAHRSEVRRLIAPLAWIFLVGAWGAPERAEALLVISPAAIRVSLDGNRPSGTFALTNVGDTTERYRARTVHFLVSESGGLVFAPPDETSLAPWLHFNPSEFEIPPQGKRIVRYSILVPGNIKPGEYWGGIEFEPLQSVPNRYTDTEGRTFHIKVLTSALVTIFGDKGAPTHSIEASEAGLARVEGKVVLKLKIRNTGQGKVDLKGGYELWGQGPKALAEGALPEHVILRGGVRTFLLPAEAELAPGTYRLKLKLGALQLAQQTESEVAVTLVE